MKETRLQRLGRAYQNADARLGNAVKKVFGRSEKAVPLVAEQTPKLDESTVQPLELIKPKTKIGNDVTDKAAHMLINFATDAALSSNPLVGKVTEILLKNHGQAPVPEIAEATEIPTERILSLATNGIFQVFPDPETNIPILHAPPLDGIYQISKGGENIITFNPERYLSQERPATE